MNRSSESPLPLAAQPLAAAAWFEAMTIVSAAPGEDFHVSTTTELLADRIANHKKDASMLRAPLWEVENITA